MLMIGTLGILAGIVVSFPVIGYFYRHPVDYGGDMGTIIENYGFEPKMYFAFQPDFYLAQSLVVAIIVLAATCYPATRIFRLKEINAIHSKFN